MAWAVTHGGHAAGSGLLPFLQSNNPPEVRIFRPAWWSSNASVRDGKSNTLVISRRIAFGGIARRSRKSFLDYKDDFLIHIKININIITLDQDIVPQGLRGTPLLDLPWLCI